MLLQPSLLPGLRAEAEAHTGRARSHACVSQAASGLCNANPTDMSGDASCSFSSSSVKRPRVGLSAAPFLGGPFPDAASDPAAGAALVRLRVYEPYVLALPVAQPESDPPSNLRPPSVCPTDRTACGRENAGRSAEKVASLSAMPGILAGVRVAEVVGVV